MTATRTACPYCGVGCGLVVTATEARNARVEPDETHPANLGRICSKGAALGDTVGLDGRLLAPLIRDRPVSWRTAVRHVARRFQRVIDAHGPDAVAFYVSGQLLIEDYYAANKLMKGFIGSANIDTNSRLCMASAVVAHTMAFGADLVPGCYEDVELADLVVFSGHNAAWTHPVLYRRMEGAKARGQRHVVIDPRRTDTAEDADVHLPIAPQKDVRLWNGLLAQLIACGAVDRAFVAAHVNGFETAARALEKDDQSLAAVAADCGVDEAALAAFFRLFTETPRTVTLFSMGANQSTQGVNKGLAIINAHLATGRIGKPGAAPFSITGQPNAMGGREVGGMANTLAAHMGFDDASCDRVARFWSAPRIARAPGLKAVDMFEAVHDGRIKALWVMATNPAVSMPNASRVREALARCPFVVVSDCMAETDTTAYAHVKLPALAWGEKEGMVTNSERRLSRQRPFFAAPGEARADWRIIADVASEMGHGDAFAWRTPADVFREYARLTAYENNGARVLDLSTYAGLSAQDYESFVPTQWPQGRARLFSDGRFATGDGRARMHPVEPRGPAETLSAKFPLALNTGRIRDQWHTMTRTALAPNLCRHAPEPFVEIHPSDAARAGVVDGKLACVETARGEAVVIARVTDRQRAGALFMPLHWTDALAPDGLANVGTAGAVDPLSGQPEFKHTPARVRGYRETWSGFFVSRRAWARPEGVSVIWRRIPHAEAHLHEFAGRGDAGEREALKRALTRGAAHDCISLEDPAAGSLRQAHIDNGRLERVLCFGARLPSRRSILSAFALPELSDRERRSVLFGGALGEADETVCACAGVGARKIAAAIQSGAHTVDDVGVRTRAGVTCGSCRPDIRRLLDEALSKEDSLHAA
jgi:assimilatory nitrate reductase catalytic subunit